MRAHKTAAPRHSVPKAANPGTVQMVDERAATASLRDMQALADRSPRAHQAAQLRQLANLPVAQRVTYKTVTYEPGNDGEQTTFQGIAEADLKGVGAWVEHRSKRLMKMVGNTTDVIADEGELAVKEVGSRQGFDIAIDADIGGISAPVAAIKRIADEIAVDMPQLKIDNSRQATIEANLGLLATEAAKLPEKMRLPQLAIVAKLDTAMRAYIAKTPWAEETTAQIQLTYDTEMAEWNLLVPDPSKSLKKELQRIEKKKTDSGKARDKKLGVLTSNEQLRTRVAGYLVDLGGATTSVPASLRNSAEQQFERGKTGYRFDEGGKAPDLTKIYIGQIEDTERTKNTVSKNKTVGDSRDKGKGVLWATPWSEGVNVGFIEVAIAGENVFKLRTAIPDTLKAFLIAGNIGAFKAAVRDKTDKAFWPFWNSVDPDRAKHRFTQFTVELETLIGSGYKLREINVPGSKAQQLMALDSQMVNINAYYESKRPVVI